MRAGEILLASGTQAVHLRVHIRYGEQDIVCLICDDRKYTVLSLKISPHQIKIELKPNRTIDLWGERNKLINSEVAVNPVSECEDRLFYQSINVIF